MVVIVKRNTPRKSLKALLRKARPKKAKGFDAKRFNGVLKLKGDPVKVQRALRDEWN
jgi:hypothetical protein